MGRAKHRPGRAGTWLEVKVRNGQRYLHERTRVYDGGKSHITSKYLYKLPPAKPEPVEQPQATAQTPQPGRRLCSATKTDTARRRSRRKKED